MPPFPDRIRSPCAQHASFMHIRQQRLTSGSRAGYGPCGLERGGAHVSGIPATGVIDRRGVLRDQYQGMPSHALDRRNVASGRGTGPPGSPRRPGAGAPSAVDPRPAAHRMRSQSSPLAARAVRKACAPAPTAGSGRHPAPRIAASRLSSAAVTRA